MNNITFSTIAKIHSPYKEKFAVPRQPGLVPSAKAQIEILPPYDDINAFSDLVGFSHIWLVFVFHKNKGQDDNKWNPTVRPPRLGGNKRIGVFATRSPSRPNPIGLSLVQFNGISKVNGKLFLEVSSIDLVDQTPIIDIKPYLPYADSKPDALAGFAQTDPDQSLTVQFSKASQARLNTLKDNYPRLQQLICEVLQQDPRPAYKKNKPDDKIYSVYLSDFNVQWQTTDNITQVLSISDRT